MYAQREIAYVQDNKEKRSKIFWEIIILRIITMSISMVIFYLTYINGTEYTIYVNGLDFNDSIGFEEALKKNIGNLKSVYNRGVSGSSSKYVVTYIGSSRDLAVDINSKAGSMGYQIIISSFDDKTITLKVEAVTSSPVGA